MEPGQQGCHALAQRVWMRRYVECHVTHKGRCRGCASVDQMPPQRLVMTRIPRHLWPCREQIRCRPLRRSAAHLILRWLQIALLNPTVTGRGRVSLSLSRGSSMVPRKTWWERTGGLTPHLSLHLCHWGGFAARACSLHWRGNLCGRKEMMWDVGIPI